jgi:hypothetical protein
MTFDEFKTLCPKATYADYVRAILTPAYVDPWDM